MLVTWRGVNKRHYQHKFQGKEDAEDGQYGGDGDVNMDSMAVQFR